ncbi:MAG: leucine--tRNA ligase [Candidatus Moranbacteria bacterium]|nr:leucine--tRNA ligase [Candidatus Moranbacteria bacterium]
MKKAYTPKSIEAKWQKEWAKSGVYRQYGRKKKFYVLDMFPYPSGAGLHVGHPKGYIATDVLARMKQLQGYGVLHPMGWDAFGLPAEQFALKNKVHPEKAVKENIATFKKQLGKIGFTYDWEREINTTDPTYYKWTQWIFLQLWKKGLAYESNDPINWCPSCKTGLANEDLEQGKCERCGSIVEKRPLRQWVLKMTQYADRLLSDLDPPAGGEKLEWSESIKEQQRNWIGRSVGTEVTFCVADTEEEIHVYTTRVDTIFSCTYVILAPEHPLLKNLESRISNLGEVKKYIKKTISKSDLERTELNKEKTGVELKGIFVINPATTEKIPVWIADFVLGQYGTGAVFADAHDKRDFEMAKKYNIPLKVSIKPQNNELSWEKIESLEECFEADGVLVNSGQFNGLTSADARREITAWLIKEKLGKKKVNYKMRDWTFSRQRYWGEPIPLIHCEKCGIVAVPEKDLPVKLPKVKSYEPTGTGESPLASIASWVNVKCPKCRGAAKRETNTMPQWAGSSWYYLRFIDPKNSKALVDKKKEKKMMPVDVYVGGTEHATRHLLYARFWHKFLYDIKAVSGKEPFKKLVNQGLIVATDGRKMSKRWNNVVNPDDMVAQFGADAFRIYEMFMGPFTQSIAWNTDGVVGSKRFLEKVWKLQEKVSGIRYQVSGEKSIENLLHKTIKKVTEDIENFKFNTAISALMILVNALEKEVHLSRITYQTSLLLLSPFAPHISEELWHMMGNKKSIFLSEWPKWDAKKIVEEVKTVVVQVNGKVRAMFQIATGSDEEAVKTLALADAKVQTHIAGKQIRKVIYVQDKILNLVV